MQSVRLEFDALLSCFTDRRLPPLELPFLSRYANRLSEVNGALFSSARVRSEIEQGLKTLEAEASRAAEDAQAQKEKQNEVSHWLEERIPQRLELSIVGSLAFWITVALLAAWSIRRHSLVHKSGHDQVTRCFWAKGDLAEYHDQWHGTKPRHDRELFERLSLFMLNVEAGSARAAQLRTGFLQFDLEKLAQLRSSWPVDGVEAALTRMVIENAKRIHAFELAQTGSETVDLHSSALLHDLEQYSALSPTAFITHIRSFLQIPRALKVGTFLQSVGLLPGAHFAGCHRSTDEPAEV
jgi:hypothetical protein